MCVSFERSKKKRGKREDEEHNDKMVMLVDVENDDRIQSMAIVLSR